jgi:CheY-like chemotaxis protein
MISAKQHPPVILLLGERTRGSDSIDRWLAESRYSVIEAADVFQALEQISDFTLRDRPDVVFMHVDPMANGLEFVQTIVTTAADEPDVPIIDFADGPKARDAAEFEKALAGLACRLDEFIPMHHTAGA